MSRRLGAFLRSLEIRLVVPLCLTIALVLAVHALLGFRSAKAHFSRLVEAEVQRCSELVMGATHDGMLLDRPQEVQATIERLAGAPEIVAIRVYDKDGRIARSADPGELGRTLSMKSDTCLSCHESGEEKEGALLEHQKRLRAESGHDVLSRLTVIENQPSCSTAACHVHPPEQKVIGVLDVEMSMEPYEAAIVSARTQLLWTTLVLVGVSGGLAALFVRRVVQRPVRALHAGTRRIAAGDLETHIDVRGAHELARLGEAFNHMVADLRSAREDITRWSATLEQRVEAKTAELQQAQRQVLHMETMASLGKLSATVAHELNNPIAGILTYARLVKRELRDHPIDPRAREEIERYLTLIDRESTRCGAIVHNLLTFARRKGADMASVDLNEIADRSIMLVRHHMEMHGVRLEHQPLEGDSTIVADPGQIEQAFLALMMNAIEAMQASCSPDLCLGVRLSGDLDSVEIEISDTGVGIPPEFMPHIFEPFFSTKGKSSGVGLGLSVVYGIVNRHGGVIDVESTVGVGSTFHLHLPRRPPPRSNEIALGSADTAVAAEGGCP
ncbi:MAG: HAMP domain-containing protein [Phycisphaerales bacterium]|nr:HAMP domain-containing protein [Phycisphaerales bacterium]